MREISETLLSAQQSASRTPYVKLEAKNRRGGIVRADWVRLYTGTEPDYYHALAIPGDGSLIRVRLTPPGDGRKLYRQRVADPAPEADFSQWAYSGQYNIVTVAACALNNEVSVFFIKSDRSIYHLKSSDNGASWSSPELIDYSPTTAIYGISAAYKPNGDIGLFFADQSTLYVKRQVSSSWQTKTAWDKSTGDLSGAAAVYDGDFKLLVTGQDTGGNFKLWSLIYGDSGSLPAGSWSDLREVASAPADSGFEYRQAFLDQPDTCRCCYVEKFTGTEAYSRPYQSYAVPDVGFGDNRWHEPLPIDLSSDYGLAMTHHGGYGWLSRPDGVWRANLSEVSLDLSADIISVREELDTDGGSLTVELDNSDGRYSVPGESELTALDIGNQLDLSPGYVTAEGNEASSGPAFQITAMEHTSADGKASLIIQAADGWMRLRHWRARHQFRWNRTGAEMSVRDILAFVFSRCGIGLEVISQSEVLTSYYPDFSINPSHRGDDIIRKLLAFVPDVILIEGNNAWAVNPSPEDSAVYSYGGSHPIVEGRYRNDAWELNHIRVEGYDATSDEPVIASSYAWDEIDQSDDRIKIIEDRNIKSAARRRRAVPLGFGRLRSKPPVD